MVSFGCMECDLARVKELGDILGVSRQRAAQLAETPGFPSPVADLASGRIWRVQDVRLWAETRRRGGRPRSGFRIEYVGDRDDRRNGRHIVSLRLVDIDEPRLDRAIHRSIDRGLVAFASQQLATERPPAQALLSVRRALANLCGLSCAVRWTTQISSLNGYRSRLNLATDGPDTSSRTPKASDVQFRTFGAGRS